jgi:hypothetical protein
MIRILITLTFTSLVLAGYSQMTYVPDDNFEQKLIDLGYDDVLDDSVLTSNIDALIGLNIEGCGISDLTGIEDFAELISLSCYMNNLDTLALGANTALRFLNCNANQINDLDLSENVLMREIACSGNEMDEIVLANLIELREFNAYGNNFTAIDFSDCPELELVTVGANLFTHLDFSNNPNLTYLNCSDNNVLYYLSVKNGNNEVLETYNSTFCPRLLCIEVDDPSYSEINWLDRDPLANFNESCGLTVEENAEPQVSVYPNPATEFLNIEISDEQMNYSLSDISGKLVDSGILGQGINAINVGGLPTGVYFITLKNERYNATLKTVVK